MTQITRTPKDLGTALRKARKAQNLTQAELANRAGIWQRTVSNIETGAGGAKVDTIFDLLAALDLEIRISPRSKMKQSDLEDIF